MIKSVFVHDIGTGSTKIARYPYFAAEVASTFIGGMTRVYNNSNIFCSVRQITGTLEAY